MNTTRPIGSQLRTGSATNLFEQTRNSLFGNIRYLDSLRAIAVMLVILANVGLNGDRNNDFLALKVFDLLANAGWIGVQLFFVLSGFLITGILLDSQNSKHHFRNFYARRFLRIFPLYYTVLFFCVIVLPALNAAPIWLRDDQHMQVWYWFYLVNWAIPFRSQGLGLEHFWSLAVEEQFYVLWPLVVALTRYRTLIFTCALLMASALAFRAAMVLLNTPTTLSLAYHATCARWDALAVGSLLATMIRDRFGFELLARWAGTLLTILCGCIAATVIYQHGFSSVVDSNLGLNQTLAALVFGVIIFMLVVHAASGKPVLRLDNALLRAIGKRSYAIYVFELPVSHVWFATVGIHISKLTGPPVLWSLLYNVVGVFLVSWFLAAISWLLLEQPMLRLKRFFVIAKSPNPPSAATASSG